jgi:hypothetical protein
MICDGLRNRRILSLILPYAPGSGKEWQLFRMLGHARRAVRKAIDQTAGNTALTLLKRTTVWHFVVTPPRKVYAISRFGT